MALSTSTLTNIPGDVDQLTATVRDQTGAPMSGAPLTWVSSNDQVASVSATGTVTALALGQATIRVTSGAVSGTATVTVSPYVLDWSVETGGSFDDSFGVAALTEEGAVVWGFQTGGDVYSSPALGTDGTVYVGSDDGGVYALSASGSLQWRFETGAPVQASPAIGGDGTVYVGSDCMR